MELWLGEATQYATVLYGENLQKWNSS